MPTAFATESSAIFRTMPGVPEKAAISLASEIPSIRWGFPYGLYHYLWEGPTGLDPREPSIFGVPCFSTLSYVFLNYAAICLAIGAVSLSDVRQIKVYLLQRQTAQRASA